MEKTGNLTEVVPLGKCIKLSYYHEMMHKHIELVARRILNGEKIEATEKLNLIFKNHTDRISKGKSHKSVKFGVQHTDN